MGEIPTRCMPGVARCSATCGRTAFRMMAIPRSTSMWSTKRSLWQCDVVRRPSRAVFHAEHPGQRRDLWAARVLRRFTLRAFGVPTAGRKQPGHATLAHWHPDGWKTTLGGNWGLGPRGRYSTMTEGRPQSYGADVNFLASSQAREDATAFMRVKRAQWIGAMVGEAPKPGLLLP